MPVLRRIGCLATCRAEGGQGEIHLIRGAALAWRGSTVRWVGREADLPASEDDGESWDAGGRLVVPGLVDSHTHLAFGGWRADEFVAKLAGTSYAEIARAGGGIASTVRETRAMDSAALLDRSRDFLRAMAALGVTTVEAKSGYGLDEDTELRVLEIYRALAHERHARVVATYLGAHVVPPEYAGRRGEYVALVADEMIPRVAAGRLARFCDVFVEEGAFTADDARRIAAAARRAGLLVKLHVDQLGEGGGAALAAELGAVSADHLEHVTPEGIAALARAGVVAVTLPFAALTLGKAPPPARAMITAGVPVAVATDFNPGTAPSYHLPLAMLLACTLMRLSPAEALKGATVFAARALALDGLAGSLAPGKSADLALVDAPDVDHWLYHFRPNACLLTVHDGAETWRAPGFDPR